jgi:hypothetical protein
MTSTDHPPRESDRWANPDLCPFCGETLADGGAGFMDHIDEAPVCKERFDDWKEQISSDIGGEWGG